MFNFASMHENAHKNNNNILHTLQPKDWQKFQSEISKLGCEIIETLFTAGALENSMHLAKLNNEFSSLAYVLDINVSKEIYCRINKLNCYMILLCCIAYVFKVSVSSVECLILLEGNQDFTLQSALFIHFWSSSDLKKC